MTDANTQTPPSRSPGKDRAFIADEGFCNATYQGRSGFKVKVRLMSYRALPLSCIEAIELKVDNQTIDPETITFILGGYGHKLEDLGRLSQVWWFILDYAELFVPCATPLAAGEHEVEGTLTTVEPYITAGRFSLAYPSKKRLRLESEVN